MSDNKNHNDNKYEYVLLDTNKFQINASNIQNFKCPSFETLAFGKYQTYYYCFGKIPRFTDNPKAKELKNKEALDYLKAKFNETGSLLTILYAFEKFTNDPKCDIYKVTNESDQLAAVIKHNYDELMRKKTIKTIDFVNDLDQNIGYMCLI